MSRLKTVFFALAAFVWTSAHWSAERPNFVWIMLEDWGPDMSCYGRKGVETPVSDRLAEEGIRYNKAFCTSPVCSTSRSAMMTGFHQNYIGAEQHRLSKDEKLPLPYGIKPLPLLLKERGYFSVLMKSNKTDCNFDADLGFEKAKDWKEREPGQPFFAQITLTGTHRRWKKDPIIPVDPSSVELPPYYVDTAFCRQDWANGLEQMQLCDREIGEILERLDKEGLRENTVVFLVGDNGSCHIRGKQFLYEAGLQVPLIVRWPGKVAEGQVSDDLVQMIDVTATILEAAGVTPPHPLHGKNIFSDEVRDRSYLFAARGRMGATHDAMRAVRTDRFKLIHNLMPEREWLQYSGYKEESYPMLAEMSVLYAQGKLNADQARFFAPTKPDIELYDLDTDPHELQNLASDPKYSLIKDELLGELYAWRASIEDMGVRDEFRFGGRSAEYPVHSEEEWRAILERWKPWVFRAADSEVKHPFAKY